MKVSRDLYQGIVLTDFPVSHDLLTEDMVKPRDVRWFKDEFDGGVDFRMKTNGKIYWVRWVGPWSIEVRKYLKKLLMRWHYDEMGVLPTKRPDRLPFTYQHHQPIEVYETV